MRCGYILMDVLLALAVSSAIAVSSLMILSFGGSYYASVDVRKQIAVSTFSFLEQREAGIIPPTERFQKGSLTYTIRADNRGLFKGENIAVEGNEENQRQRIIVWHPFFSP